MLSTIIPESSTERDPFTATLTVDSRSTGGTTLLTPEHIEWLGETLIKVELPGHTVHLKLHEARDLAAALQNLATYIEEDAL